MEHDFEGGRDKEQLVGFFQPCRRASMRRMKESTGFICRNSCWSAVYAWKPALLPKAPYWDIAQAVLVYGNVNGTEKNRKLELWRKWWAVAMQRSQHCAENRWRRKVLQLHDIGVRLSSFLLDLNSEALVLVRKRPTTHEQQSMPCVANSEQSLSTRSFDPRWKCPTF